MELELSHVILSVIKISVSDRNVHLDDFYFFQVNESTLYDFESLSFANKINDQRLSLVYQFYKQGLIDNPSFGFLSTNFGNGNLILGKFNNTIISQNRYSASCPVVKEKNTWGCELNKIIIGDKEYRNYDYSYFVVDERKIFAPRKFFSFLKEKIMKPFIMNQTCELFELGRSSYFECQCESIMKMENFKFVLGNHSIDFSIEKLIYKQSQRKCLLLIEENIKYQNEWILGIPFINGFPIQFDYASNSVSMYSNKEFNVVEVKSISTMKSIFYMMKLCSILMSIFIILLFII